MINLRYFCFVVIQLYLKVRALALFYFINLHHYTYITNCQNKLHRNPANYGNPDVFQLISRDATYTPSQSIPAQAGKNKQNTSESNNFFQSRCIPINFPRIYLLALAVYSRASQPHLISRASRQKNNSYTNFTLSAPKRALRASASALPLTVILRGSSFLSLPSTM